MTWQGLTRDLTRPTSGSPTLNTTRPLDSLPSVAVRTSRRPGARASSADTDATRRARPVTAAKAASSSHGSSPSPLSQSESAPAASSARASARYSPGSSNRAGSWTPIFSAMDTLHLRAEDDDDPQGQPADEHQQ